MLSPTSNTTPLIAQTSKGLILPEYVTVINPDGTVSYERNTQYQQPTIIRRTYAKQEKPKQRYNLEQVNFIDIDHLFPFIFFFF